MASDIEDNFNEYDIITDFNNLNLIFQHQLQSLCLSLADKYNLNQKHVLEDFFSNYNFTFENLNKFHSKYFKLKKKKKNNYENKCLARNLNLQQCTKNKKIKTQYCISHQYRRPYGTINDELPIQKLFRNKKISVIKHLYQGNEYYLDIYNKLYIENETNSLNFYGTWDPYKEKIDISKYWLNKNNKKNEEAQ